MRENTKQSSDQLREITGLVMLIGIIIGFGSGTLVIFSISVGSSNTFMGIGGVGLIILCALVIFWHYVVLVMISAYATIVEKSDRTAVVGAIWEVAENLQQTHKI